MTKRVLLTGVLAGIGMFAWSSIAHMALPLGEAGIQQIPNEEAVLSSMQATLGTASGLYFFPGVGNGSNEEKMQAYEKKLATSPSGILIYHPAGFKNVMARMLGVEFATELLVSILAVLLLAQTRLSSFASKFGFVTLIGLIASIMTNVQYWNWYGYPMTYTLAYMTTQFAGFLVVGAIAAAMLKQSPQVLRMAA